MLDESHETSVHVQLLIEEEIRNDKCIQYTFFFILSIFLWIINMSGNIISTDCFFSKFSVHYVLAAPVPPLLVWLGDACPQIWL